MRRGIVACHFLEVVAVCDMKIAVEIYKAVQTGAGAGLVVGQMVMGKYRQQEQQILEIFLLVCIVLALVSPVFLWVSGERKRAWQGLVVTILLATLAGALGAPQLIR